MGTIKDDTMLMRDQMIKAAESGDLEAKYQLGWACMRGSKTHEFEKEEKEGFRWLFEAAGEGHVSAMDSVAVCYEYGNGVKKDWPSALRWYQAAADQGHEGAQTRVAVHSFQIKDYEKVHWLCVRSLGTILQCCGM